MSRATKKKRGVQEDEEHFWPGYVDALTNVVINLLFLISIFTLAVFVVSTQKIVKETQENQDLNIPTLDVHSRNEVVKELSEDDIKVDVKSGDSYKLYIVSLPRELDARKISTSFLSKYVSDDVLKKATLIDIWASASDTPNELRGVYFAISTFRNFFDALKINGLDMKTRIYTENALPRNTKQYFILIRFE